LKENSGGFSGREIEKSIYAAMYDGLDEGREFTTEDILKALKATTPLARTSRAQIERLRGWAINGGVRFASSDTDKATREPIIGPTELQVDLPQR